jgi:hypothetical protein
LPVGAAEYQRVSSPTAVRRRDDSCVLAPIPENAVDRPRGQVRPVGEHDYRGLDVTAERR